MLAKNWLIQPPSPEAEAASLRWQVPHLVGQILLNRGLSPQEPPDAFLAPQLKNLHSPALLPGTKNAASLIVAAIRSRTKIAVYGDYDVDGITGVAVLWHILRKAGGDVTFYVPHRIEEGYGVNVEAVRRLVEEGVGFIISVDCGITARDAAEVLRQRGVPLVITDHHAFHGPLPEAAAIVHPALDDGYPNRDLCGAGVAFKLAWAVAQSLNGCDRVAPEFRELLMDLLPFVALGTIADVVPLMDENRILARRGLDALVQTRWPGLRALIQSAGLSGERISGHDVGFKLAPRLNAAGRMGHARLAVELLTRADEARAAEIAQYLEEQNGARQSTERRIAHEANEMIENNGLASDARRAIVLASPGWHPGVIGIVAARLTDRYHRPAVLIALDGQLGQGSGRSIHPFDLAEAFAACGDHLQSFGGHAMAAGLRITADRIEAFTEAFVQRANSRLTGVDLVPRLRLDAEVRLDELTLATAECLVALGPFGIGNPKARLATDWLELADEPRNVGRNSDHLQAKFRQNGAWMKAIGFGFGAHLEDLKQHRRCRVAFEPIVNEFQGRRSVEMQILDLQFPE